MVRFRAPVATGRIYDGTGRLVVRVKAELPLDAVGKDEPDLDGLAAGMYWLECRTDKEAGSQKFLKARTWVVASLRWLIRAGSSWPLQMVGRRALPGVWYLLCFTQQAGVPAQAGHH